MTVMKYNPGFLTHDELIESFCVRTHEFESIIEMLRECDSNSNPHRLVIGPRGCGKTSLLLRVAVEIVRDQELSLSLFPIVFSEESYGVANSDEFWLEALYRLAEQTTRLEGDDDLKLTYKELREIRDDRTLGKRCLSTLLDFSNRYGKRLVLIVENLNLMFRDIMDAEAGWKLRHTLQTEPRIILLASSTSRFDEIDKSDRAFYDLFVCQTLQPLGTVECAILWENVSGQHRLPDEMRGLRILTGGSPRLLSIIAKFRADLSFRDLMTDLLKLIDDLTEYFKSHIEALPPQERRVYVALAELWEPATAREVAIQARLGTSKCSALLNRLVERGAVEVVGGGARRKLYYLAERLYNIYYLLRRSHTQKPLIEALIRFMDAYYSPPELRDVGIRMVREASELESETKTLHWTAFARLIDLPVLAADRKELLSKVPKDLAENFGLELSPAVAESIKSTHLESATSKPDKIITEHDEELAIYEEIVRRFGDSNIPTLLEVAADATIRKIFALGRLNRLDEAVIACDEATKPFSASDAPQVVEQVATIFFLKGETLKRLKRPSEAIVAYGEVVQRFGDSKSDRVCAQVALALNKKGDAFNQLKLQDKELAAYDEVVRRFGGNVALGVQVQVAHALINKGIALGRMDRSEEELAVYDEVVRRFGDNETLVLIEQVAKASLFRGVTLSELDRKDEAIATFGEMVHRFGNSNTPEILELVAEAQFNEGRILNDSNRLEESIIVCDEIARRFSSRTEPVIIELTARALYNKSGVLGRMNRLKEAIAVCEEVDLQFRDSDLSGVLEVVAQALMRKGNMLDHLKRPEKALAVYDDVLRRFGDSEDPAILVSVARTLYNKSGTLDELNRFEEALTIYEQIDQQFRDSDVSEILDVVIHAHMRKGDILVELNRPIEAVAVFDEIVRRFGDTNITAILEVISQALLYKASLLIQSKRYEEAITTCEDIEWRFSDDEIQAFQVEIARALVLKGAALVGLGQEQKAKMIWKEAVRRFESSEDADLSLIVSMAMLQIAELAKKQGQFDETITTIGQLFERDINQASHQRCEGLLIRAHSFVALGDALQAERDIEEALALLPDFDHLLGAAIDVLIDFTVLQGPQHAKKIIQASPSVEQLVPVTIAIDKELGNEPRVAREIEEVAEDIRRDLENRQKGNN